MKTDEEVRAQVIDVLKRKGYAVEIVGSGSGVPKSSRLSLSQPGERSKMGVVKVTTSGRISFPHKDGKWTPLHKMDCVLYAHDQGDGKIRVQMFSREVIEKAFDTLRTALSARNMGHIPHWLAPFHEQGERFIGSGFGDKAEWTVDIDPGAASVPSPASSLSEAIEQAKGIIANALGRNSREIDLTVSFRS
jgi:hypothetical protein